MANSSSADRLIASTTSPTVVVEGNHYFPESALDKQYTAFSNHRTRCAWKGQAHYHSLLVNGEMNPDAAWYYPEPSETAANIKGRLAFWKGVKVSEGRRDALAPTGRRSDPWLERSAGATQQRA